jgi:hypothetical protein
MGKQFRVSVAGAAPLAVDLRDDEEIYLRIEHLPLAEVHPGKPSARVRVAGAREDGADFVSFYWAHVPISLNDRVTVDFLESEEPGTPPQKVDRERSFNSERSCSFCRKSSVEVQALFVSGDLIADAAICGECVELLHQRNK